VRVSFYTLFFALVCSSLALAADNNPTRPLVASLVPAATDLIVSMGAGEHLVGISNYDDSSRPELKHLPKIGDYQTIDWERLRALKPQILITFQAPDRISPGVKERAAKLNLKLVNIRTETLADLFIELKNIGQLLGEQEKAAASSQKLQDQLDTIHQRLRNLPPVKTLLLRDESASATVGQGNFLNDILELSGGQNVIEDSGWPTIDRERLASLNPDAIIILLSNAPPQVEKQAAATIGRMAHLTAVKTNRVKIINVWYSQQPGLHLGDLARQFADFLHPEKGASISPYPFNRRDAQTQSRANSSPEFLCWVPCPRTRGHVFDTPATCSVWLTQKFADSFQRQISTSTSPRRIQRRDAEAQSGANSSAEFLCWVPCPRTRGHVFDVPATWSVCLGCDESPRRQGQPLPRGASPLTPLHPLPPFLPAIDWTSSSESPKVTLIKTDFRGVAGGTYSAPMRLRISEKNPGTPPRQIKSRSPSPSPTPISQISTTSPTKTP
jgi:iron complex transport system substrate-binding protein